MKKYLVMLTAFVMMLTLVVGATAETYTDWTSSTTLPSKGAYKLTTDVTLTSEVTIGAWSGSASTLTLDLNGHTVTITGNGHVYVQNTGTLVITDTVGTGKITNAATMNRSEMIQVKGAIEINGGTIENTLASKTAVFVQNDSKKASCTLNGGKVENSYTKSGRAISIGQNASFVMNGGTVESDAVGNPNHLPAVEVTHGASTATINGGTIKAAGSGIQSSSGLVTVTGGTIDANYGLYTRNAVVDPAPGSTVTITAQSSAVLSYDASATGTGNQIKGGTINAPELVKGSAGSSGENVTVSGGTFKGGSEDGAQDHLANGTVIDPVSGIVITARVPAVSYSVPQTGDNTPIALLMCMLLLAGAGLLILKRRGA